jgi:hypothetical protein
VLESREAASRTEPAAVTHERSGCGDRNRARPPSDVWLSSMSMNHVDQGRHTSISSSSRSRRAWKRWISSTPDGGLPAWIAFIDTSASRREKAAYVDGR